MLSAVFLLLGIALVLLTLLDAADTLVSTRIRSGRWWPTEVFYRVTWFRWRALCRRVGHPGRRESLLAVYGPASLLALLALWVVGQILGWSLVWWALASSFAEPLEGWVDGLYYSGIVYFSVGFGDVLPGSDTVRVLALLEAFGGLATMGLVIGFIPSLLGAYQARERHLLRLDAFSSERITPMELAVSVQTGPRAGRVALDRFFDEWESWTAELMQGHASFPMLGLFRSQFHGQHWLTALGLVTDTAIVVMCTDPDEQTGCPMRLYRRSVHAIRAFCERIGVQPIELDSIPFEMFENGVIQYAEALTEPGRDPLSVTDPVVREAYERMVELRAEFAPWMEALIDALDAPRGFWGVEIERLTPGGRGPLEG